VTTSADLKALVEVVGGDQVRVESLASPLQDPHTLDLKPGQVTALRAADLLVRIGLDHEPWLTRAVAVARDQRSPGLRHDLDVSTHVELLQTETPRLRERGAPHVHGFGNTHYWLDPENARPMTGDIEAALARLRPADGPVFEQNRRRFLARLDERLADWQRRMALYKGRRVVVVHDTWPYFCRRFGLVVAATVETTPGVPPTAGTLATLPQRMKEAGVKVLIAEPSSNESVVTQIANRSGARRVTLIPSVGAAPAAHDYLELFEINITRLTAALAGTT
jgi:zinc/manganese transport system substrate-binding protein